MTVYIKPYLSEHQRYYSNPLNPVTSIWKIQLMVNSFKIKRVSMKGRYKPYQMKFSKNLGSVRYKKNPVKWILESENDRRVYGKFNR